MDCSPSGFSIRGVFQARILEWAATPFSRGSSPPRGWAWISHLAGRFFTWPLPRTLDEDLNGFTGVSYELVQKRALDSTFPHPDWLLFQAPCLRKGQHNPLGYLRQKSRDVPGSSSPGPSMLRLQHTLIHSLLHISTSTTPPPSSLGHHEFLFYHCGVHPDPRLVPASQTHQWPFKNMCVPVLVTLSCPTLSQPYGL